MQGIQNAGMQECRNAECKMNLGYRTLNMEL